MDEEKIRTISEWQEPRNVKEIQSSSDLPTFTTNSKDYSQIITPFIRLTRKEVQWEWGEKQQRAFNTLKEAMEILEAILQYFDQVKPVTIEKDASDYTIGAVCWQPDENGVLHPVAYYSRNYFLFFVLSYSH
jgi:polysaccharide pyruvyl transferase WcaK-like protein